MQIAEIMEIKKHGLAGKPSNNAKPDNQKAESTLYMRCLTRNKSAWVKAAQAEGLKLTEWATKTLNEKASK